MDSPETSANMESLHQIVKGTTELYDLHAHLLGMGNSTFWVENTLENSKIMPTNGDFHRDGSLRQKLCPLIWDGANNRFIEGKQVDLILQCVCAETGISMNRLLIENELSERLRQEMPPDANEVSQKDYVVAVNVLCKLLCNEKFKRQLHHYDLRFSKNFSYDVVLSLPDLAKALGVEQRKNDLIQTAIEEILGFHTLSDVHGALFRYWIIFNAREQRFEVVYGITIERLCRLIKIDPENTREANIVARAYIKNAFSMCNAEGATVNSVDLHRYHGMFTPEFYPRRFALKDSIYSQRLDVLAHLLLYVLDRYEKCQPRVTYCELSVGLSDLTRPWVFDVLCSFPTAQASVTNSSFRELMCNGRHFPELEKRGKEVQCVYKFLAGFKRHEVQNPLHQNQAKALDLLSEAPQVAIHVMLNEISKSSREERVTEGGVFHKHIQGLKMIKEFAATRKDSFYKWVVGLDLFGDEMGFPYCPFVAWDFIDYINERRKENRRFSIRIHCGENVPFADYDAPAYRHFLAHMYIVFRSLRYLQQQLEYGIRIGHGIAFERILNRTMSSSKQRKSSVLLAEIEDHARYVFKTIAFEVNITSNEYLLGNALRQGNSIKPLLQIDALLELDAPIILATDDDGVWPIDDFQGHQSLPAEYAKAICKKIIEKEVHLKSILENTKQFRFYSDSSELSMPIDKRRVPVDVRASPVVIHPVIIKYILSLMRQCGYTGGKFYKDFERTYPQTDEIFGSMERDLAPIAHISYCMNTTNEESLEEEYNAIFPNRPPFEHVYENVKKVYETFIESDNYHQSAICSLSFQVPNEEISEVFYSEGPYTADSEQNPPMRDLIDYLPRHTGRIGRVYIFTRHINEKTVNEMPSFIQRDLGQCPEIFIFSNKDKEKYIDIGNHHQQIYVNPQPWKRTRSDTNEPNQNGLYAVCPHASAATSFLHSIARAAPHQ